MNVARAQALGFATLLGASAGERRAAAAPVTSQGPLIGFTAPTILYDEIRAIDADATRLDANVRAYVSPSSPFAAAWAAWLPQWQAFRDKYLTSDLAKLGAVFYTDDLARSIETYRQQLAGLYQDYANQANASGRAVPPLAPPGPVAPPIVPGQTTDPRTGQPSASLLPWWGWMLLGVAAVGGGYLLYRRYVGPAAARLFGGGRDADRDEGPLAEYARDPRARGVALPSREADVEPLPEPVYPPAYRDPEPRFSPFGYARDDEDVYDEED